MALCQLIEQIKICMPSMHLKEPVCRIERGLLKDIIFLNIHSFVYLKLRIIHLFVRFAQAPNIYIGFGLFPTSLPCFYSSPEQSKPTQAFLILCYLNATVGFLQAWKGRSKGDYSASCNLRPSR